MIRINLLGRARPKAARKPMPMEGALQGALLLAAAVVSIGVLWYYWAQLDTEAGKLNTDISQQQREKARLQNLKSQVENFEKEKVILQQRINIIEDLQRNRTGGQELLDALANTVSRTDTLWLTSLDRKGSSLTIQGSAGSINAVANFITELKRSGYFEHVEIKESHEDDSSKAVQTFVFQLSAQFVLPGAKPPAPAAAPAPNGAPAPARKG